MMKETEDFELNYVVRDLMGYPKVSVSQNIVILTWRQVKRHNQTTSLKKAVAIVP